MPDSPHNYDEIKVHVLPPLKMEIVTDDVQFTAPSEFQIRVQMTTLIPETGEEVIFEDCTNIQFDIQLSDDINFEVTKRASSNAGGNFNSCAQFSVRAHNPASMTEITLNFYELTTGRSLMAEKTIETYSHLDCLHPPANRNDGGRTSLFLAYGSHSSVILRGGPLPMIEDPDTHYTRVEVKNEDLILVKKDEEKSNRLISKQDDREYLDHHVIDVTCL